MPKPSVFLLTMALAAPCTVMANPIDAGTTTHGGAIKGAALIHVTTLADDGAGSLREAIRLRGPKVIVFDVGGTIHLKSHLKISIDRITIAGQSAPEPGITLAGGTLLLRANDLVVQHIAIRPGPAPEPDKNRNQDSVTIGGGTRKIHDVRVENVSVSWSVDENADIAGGTRNITFRNSLIAEALNNAGHPSGDHSMGMLINKDNTGVSVTGNLFVSNKFRNPAIARGSEVVAGYNYIVNPGENATHFYSASWASPIRAAVFGNVVSAGLDTESNVTAVQIPVDMASKAPDAQIYLGNNQSAAGPLTNQGNFHFTRLSSSDYEELVPPDDLHRYVLRYAGSRPGNRNAIDSRIVAGAKSGASKIVDTPPDADQMSKNAKKTAPQPPSDPFAPSRIPGMLRIESWLCQRHLEVGGPATPECSRSLSDYVSAYR